MKKYDIPSDLTKAAKEGKLVLFVGSGVSQDLRNLKGEKLGDWNDMVRLISDIVTKRGLSNDTYGPYLGSVPARALEEMEKMGNLPYDEIRSSLREHYAVSKENDFELHRLLPKLSSKIITLNYDNAFETANNNDIPVAYRGQDYENAEVLKKNRWLFKLHGSISSLGSLVIFPSDYYRLYEKGAEDELSEQIKFLFEHILVSNTILFIGTGLSEFQINNTFKKIKKYLDVLCTPHYIITDKERLSTDLEGIVKPIKIQSFDELKDIIQQMLQNKVEEMPNPIAIQPSVTPKIRISVMGHTNTGKTTLLRCLLKERVGMVQDIAGATTKSQIFSFNEILEISDTPGFERAGTILAYLDMLDEEAAKKKLKDKRFLKEIEILNNLQGRNDVIFYVTTIDTVPEDGHGEELALIKKYTESVIAIINKSNTSNTTSGLPKEDIENRINLWKDFFVTRKIGFVVYDFHWDRPYKQVELMNRVSELIPSDKSYAYKRFLSEMKQNTLERRNRILNKIKEAIKELDHVNKTVLLENGKDFDSEPFKRDLLNHCVFIFNKFTNDICNIYKVPTAEDLNINLPSIEEVVNIVTAAETKKKAEVVDGLTGGAIIGSIMAIPTALSIGLFVTPIAIGAAIGGTLFGGFSLFEKKTDTKKIEYKLSNNERFDFYKSLLAIVWTIAYYGFEKNYNRGDMEQRIKTLLDKEMPEVLNKRAITIDNFEDKLLNLFEELGI